MEILIDRKCNGPGVYKITNLIDDKVYIGSTNKLYKRATEHHGALRRGEHGNDHVKHAASKHGWHNFKIEVQELCNLVQELPAREKYWIVHYDATNPAKGYNIATDTECPFRGIPKPQKWRDKMEKTYHLIDPQGCEVHVTGMQKFCRDKKLSQQNMVPMLRGKTHQAHGWRLYKPELVGVPYDAAAAKQEASAKQWATRPKDTVKLPYTIEELVHFYEVDKLSLAKIAAKCGKKDWTYIRKVLIKAGVKMRGYGGK